jgi:hypothetical protein
MSSATLPLSLVNEYAETQLAQRLSTIAGVAQVQIYGSQKFAVRIQANPDSSPAGESASTNCSRRCRRTTSISRWASSTANARVLPSGMTGN